MGRKKKNINKELIAEDWCFDCKDGGTMRVCDYKDCLKGFHPRCVDKDDSFLKSEVSWTCRWHFCFICKNTPKFYCFCCPKAVCGVCLCDAEFAVVKRKKGFCSHCVTLAGLLEGIKIPDSDPEKVDFNEQGTYEFNFKGYWEMIKEKEGLTSKHIRHAVELLSMGKNSDYLSDSYDFCGGEEDASEFDENISDNDNWNGRKRSKGMQKRKRNKNSCVMNRKLKSKKMEFNGWASELLFNFLASIGKDATSNLSQLEVTDIVMGYCNEHKLYHPEKKKKVLCDARLKSLLGRKLVNKNSIYNLLTRHFAENLEQSDSELGSEDKGENVSPACKRQKASSLNTKYQDKEPDPDAKEGCFAAVNTKNIKLLYLKRSLVEELAKQPDTFDAKVIGSFVRTKSDPYDYLQKNPYQLLKVTGVKRISRDGEVNADILLQFSNMPKDMPICKLSDDNFSEEECEDLRQRVKDCRLERPTLVEFKEKARSLHEVITKHGIVKELTLLQNLINQANEKGWRRELSVYMEKMMLLRQPSEQSRLLLEVPEIIADEPEVEPAEMDLCSKDKEENITTEESHPRQFSKPSSKSPRRGIYSCPNDTTDIAEQKHPSKQPEPEEPVDYSICPESDDSGMHPIESHESPIEAKHDHPKVICLENDNDGMHQPQSDESAIGAKHDHPTVIHVESDNNGMHKIESRESSVEAKHYRPEVSHHELSGPLVDSSQGQSNSLLPDHTISGEKQSIPADAEKAKNVQSATSVMIIELSDDEEQDHSTPMSKQTPDNLNSPVWYIVSPQGIKKGPCPMSVLKEWHDGCPSDMKFKVWKIGQNPREAIFLTDALHQIFSRK